MRSELTTESINIARKFFDEAMQKVENKIADHQTIKKDPPKMSMDEKGKKKYFCVSTCHTWEEILETLPLLLFSIFPQKVLARLAPSLSLQMRIHFRTRA